MIYAKRMLLLVLSGLVILSGNALSQESGGSDRIVLNGSSVVGNVKGFTATKYVFQTKNNGEKQFPRSKVFNVQYGDTNESIASLQKAFMNGEYKRVTDVFGGKVRDQIESGELREIHKPRVSYYMAASHFRSGSLKGAREEAQKALKQYPDQIWFDELAQIWILSLAFEQYDPGNDVKNEAYKSVEEDTGKVVDLIKSRTSAPKRFIDELRVIRIQALEELGEGKLGVTKVKYENLSVESSVLKNRIFAGLHRCDVRREENLENALEAFKKRINQTNGSTLLEAGKRNIQGAIALKEWRNNGEIKQLRDALFPFLQAHLLNNEPDQLYPVQHRRSLFQAIRVYTFLADNVEKNASYYKGQAEKTLEELNNRYPGAPETQKANTMVGKK